MNGLRGSFWRRLALGMSGQAFARFALGTNTVMLVPILIRAWGVDGYGQWIALTALTSYLGLSNFGLVTISANEMVIASGANDYQRARRAFQASLNMTLFVVLPIIALLAVAVCLVPVVQVLHLTQIGPSAAHIIIAGAAVILFLQTLRGLAAAALYATGSYGFAYYVQGIMKLIEVGSIAVLVSRFSGTQVAAIIAVAVVGCIDLAVVWVAARRAAPWASINIRTVDWSWLSSQTKPTIGFLISNFATQGVMSQGARVVLSAMLGGSAVAIYSVYGTAMRFVDQLLLTLVLPLEVEIAHRAGRDDFRAIDRLVVIGTQISWVLFVGVATALLLFGPLIFHLWTAGRIAFSYGLMILYICMSAANLQGRVSLHALICTNRLYGTSFFMLLFAVAAVGLGALLTPIFGVAGMVLGGIGGEAMNSAVVILSLSSWLRKPVTRLIADLLNFRGSMGELRVQSLAILYRLRPGA